MDYTIENALSQISFILNWTGVILQRQRNKLFQLIQISFVVSNGGTRASFVLEQTGENPPARVGDHPW